MSIECMRRVWAESKHKGSQLLLLLAIADNASDDGFAWPSMQTLAKKTRMSERHTVRMLDELEQSGELILSKTEGKRHQYIVTVGLTSEQVNKTATSRMIKMSPLTSCHPRQVVTPDKLSPLTSCHKTPDKLSPLPLTSCHKTPDKLSPLPLTSCHKTPDKLSLTTSRNSQKTKDLEGKKIAEPSYNHEEEPSIEPVRVVSPSLDSQSPQKSLVSISGFPEKLVEEKLESEQTALVVINPQTLETPTQPTAQTKTLTNQQKLLEAFVLLLRLDMRIYKGGYPRLAKEISRFYNADITPEQVQKFAKWWYTEDFRGQKDQPPTLDQFSRLLTTALHWTDPETIQIDQPTAEITISRPQQPRLIPNKAIQAQQMIDAMFEAKRRKTQC